MVEIENEWWRNYKQFTLGGLVRQGHPPLAAKPAKGPKSKAPKEIANSIHAGTTTSDRSHQALGKGKLLKHGSCRNVANYSGKTLKNSVLAILERLSIWQNLMTNIPLEPCLCNTQGCKNHYPNKKFVLPLMFFLIELICICKTHFLQIQFWVILKSLQAWYWK